MVNKVPALWIVLLLSLTYPEGSEIKLDNLKIDVYNVILDFLSLEQDVIEFSILNKTINKYVRDLNKTYYETAGEFYCDEHPYTGLPVVLFDVCVGKGIFGEHIAQGTLFIVLFQQYFRVTFENACHNKITPALLDGLRFYHYFMIHRTNLLPVMPYMCRNMKSLFNVQSEINCCQLTALPWCDSPKSEFIQYDFENETIRWLPLNIPCSLKKIQLPLFIAVIKIKTKESKAIEFMFNLSDIHTIDQDNCIVHFRNDNWKEYVKLEAYPNKELQPCDTYLYNFEPYFYLTDFIGN